LIPDIPNEASIKNNSFSAFHNIKKRSLYGERVVMLITLLRCKIHNAVVTGCNIEYEGSIEIDTDLMDAVGLRAFEKVMVSDINNANRFETYVIPAKAGSGTIALNGAAAHLVEKGDRIIIFSFAAMEPSEAGSFTPSIIILNEKNRIKERK